MFSNYREEFLDSFGRHTTGLQFLMVGKVLKFYAVGIQFGLVSERIMFFYCVFFCNYLMLNRPLPN